MTPGADWEARLAALWSVIDDHEPDDFVTRMGLLCGELPPGDPVGLFEHGGSFDSTGHPDIAVPMYREALAAGLDGERRRRAVIQMSSSIRNLGRPQEALDLLTAEAARASDHLDGAIASVRALTLVDLGREREAVSVAVTALAALLPRYNRSMARYAAALMKDSPTS